MTTILSWLLTQGKVESILIQAKTLGQVKNFQFLLKWRLIWIKHRLTKPTLYQNTNLLVVLGSITSIPTAISTTVTVKPSKECKYSTSMSKSGQSCSPKMSWVNSKNQTTKPSQYICMIIWWDLHSSCRATGPKQTLPSRSFQPLIWI